MTSRLKMSSQGYDLIREFEGLRTGAYRDAVGVWTIGYGHTSAAGEPRVKPGMVITQNEAAEILERDVEKFADGVRRHLKDELTEDQFSALVSFAYNVGLGNFARSSVLKAVNARNFEAVPRRLALWNKAGGRTLPGLVRRRAAETALFTSEGVMAPPECTTAKPAIKSRTILSAVLIVIAAVANATLTTAKTILPWLLLALIIAGAAVIIQQRIHKLKQEGL
jgi:lysozyme